MVEVDVVGDRPATLVPRALGDLLNETFAIYAKHFWQFVRLVGVVQLPVSLLALIPFQGPVAFTAAVVLSVLGFIAVYGATVIAVAHHYVTGQFTIGSCYSKVWYRVISLEILGAALTVLILLWVYLASTAITGQSPLVAVVFLIVSLALLIFIVYTMFAPQGVGTELLKPVAAVKRSFGLVRGSWWRVFGIALTLFMVATGIGILLTIPFALVSASLGLDTLTLSSRLVLALNNLLTSVILLPVVFIGMTLLYYDLRVRKENYDFAALSVEIGAARV